MVSKGVVAIDDAARGQVGVEAMQCVYLGIGGEKNGDVVDVDLQGSNS